MDARFWTDPNFWIAVGQIVSSVISIFALVYSISTFRMAQQVQHYGELDKMYFDLLRISLEKPYLRDVRNLTPAQRTEYDTYAFMVWNFLETIHDRSGERNVLSDTWLPVVDAENRLHRAWFDDPANAHKFKGEFRAWVEQKFPAVSGLPLTTIAQAVSETESRVARASGTPETRVTTR